MQPERVRLNIDLDMLYLDINQEEEGHHHFLGNLKKKTELSRPKSI